MVNAGIDKVFRDSILGHNLKGMDVHYIVTTDDTLTEAMKKYTDYIDVELEKVTQTLPKN